MWKFPLFRSRRNMGRKCNKSSDRNYQCNEIYNPEYRVPGEVSLM